jgi:hypothetical protein
MACFACVSAAQAGQHDDMPRTEVAERAHLGAVACLVVVGAEAFVRSLCDEHTTMLWRFVVRVRRASVPAMLPGETPPAKPN